jgi:RNA polymerase sigma-70 factor, ECF subfamily
MCAAANIEQVGVPAAGRSDEAAFGRLVEAQRADLHAHCYRMLGSLHDADDALQDTLLRAWRALPRFRGQSSLRTWLYRIATNVCLDAIARRPKRVLPIDYGPPRGQRDAEAEEPVSESLWVAPYPDEALGIADGDAAPEGRYEQREALELAFTAALQHLPARQRAVLILRDVLGFSAKEAAESIETTVASVNGALHRARRAVQERLPERSQQATLRTLGDRRLRELVERFADAFERGDVDAILAMLAEDATFAMPPYPGCCRGRDTIADSWLMPGGPPPRLRYVPARANGQLALGAYLLDRDIGSYLPLALDVLTLRGAVIADVTAFRTPAIFPRFGLPSEVPAARPGRQGPC